MISVLTASEEFHNCLKFDRFLIEFTFSWMWPFSVLTPLKIISFSAPIGLVINVSLSFGTYWETYRFYRFDSLYGVDSAFGFYFDKKKKSQF